jgi:aerobic-type carbon monoxide dehydrogenase small subunit (CoxS/CutS family)
VSSFICNGEPVEILDGDASLLDTLREQLGLRAAKDGCSPQGQCGCCTVWVDGAPRVACVTATRRVAGRSITTVEGLVPEVADRWAAAFVETGASQCGFCTPGIVMRLAALEERRRGGVLDEGAIRQALAAHLCRCTGWHSIVEAACRALGVTTSADSEAASGGEAGGEPGREPVGEPVRDPLLSEWRAQLEGPAFQSSGPDVVLGGGGFADDHAPADALVALPDDADGYAVGASLIEARRQAGKVQGRRTTIGVRHPVEVPPGDWALTLQTTWVEPAYLEPDASWCEPGGEPASPLANGGAFGGKRSSPVAADAQRLAEEHGRPVRVLWPRETVVQRGPKRPPVAVALREDESGVLLVGRSPGSADLAPLHERVALAAPSLEVREVEIAGPPVSTDLRGAGWAEATVALTALRARANGWSLGDAVEAVAPSGGRARATLSTDGDVHVEAWAGELLDPVVLRSFCLGAVHQALGWVTSEGIAVDEEGEVHDLTIRSFGVLSARDTPGVTVDLHPSDLWPVNGSDAVFAATAAAAWLSEGLAPRWPTRRGLRGGAR